MKFLDTGFDPPDPLARWAGSSMSSIKVIEDVKGKTTKLCVFGDFHLVFALAEPDGHESTRQCEILQGGMKTVAEFYDPVFVEPRAGRTWV